MLENNTKRGIIFIISHIFLFFFISASSEASIIDFNSFDLNIAYDRNFEIVQYSEDGYSIGVGSAHLTGWGFPFLGDDSEINDQLFPYNGTPYMHIGTYSYLSLQKENHSVFNLTQLDLGEWTRHSLRPDNGLQPFKGNADYIVITGYKENSIIEHIHYLDQIFDGEGYNIDFETIFIANFTDIYGLVIEGRNDYVLTGFSVDNIGVSSSAEKYVNISLPEQYMPGGRGSAPYSKIPLPSSLATMLGGIGATAALLAIYRKRQRLAQISQKSRCIGV